MSLSLDDKLLGEKVENYCSSSEDEGEDRDDREEDGGKSTIKSQTKFIPEPQLSETQSYVTNTGPKGVINDWREYKKLENERKEEQEKERQALIKKLSMTCRSHLDDEKERQKDQQFLTEIEKNLEEFEDEFMKEYRQKRIEEMRKALQNVPKFGKVIALTSNDFVENIDKEQPQVTVIIHLYEDKISACENMNRCLTCLAQEYPTVKFCKIKASEASLSFKFAKTGVPALLVYKSGDLIGNFIRISDEIGDDFYATDVEGFLADHSLLPSSDFVNKVIKDSSTGEFRTTLPEDEDSGSDFDID